MSRYEARIRRLAARVPKRYTVIPADLSALDKELTVAEWRQLWAKYNAGHAEYCVPPPPPYTKWGLTDEEIRAVTGRRWGS